MSDPKSTIQNYVNGIKTASSLTNLKNNLRPVLSRNFHFHSESNSKGNKTEFNNYLYGNSAFYTNARVSINNSTVRFSNNGKSVSQKLYLDKENKISSIQEIPRKNQSGGMGYTTNVSINPVGGQPVISQYYNCCRPIYNGDLLKGGKSKKKTVQKGGKRSLFYYLDVADNHFNVLPQYKQIFEMI